MKQVLFVGSGRSGTTALFNAFAEGLNVTTIPAVAGRYPSLLAPSLLANRIGLRSWVLRPSSESLTFFASVGLSQERLMGLGRSMQPADLSADDKASILNAFKRVSRYGPSPTVISKNTGNTARISALAAALPESRFVYISRDPRAVVNSLLRVGFWPSMPLWWAGKTPTELEQEGWSPAAIAATHWLHQVAAAEDSFARIDKGRVHRLSYESLVTEPREEIDRLLEFLAPAKPLGIGVQAAAFRSSSLESWRTSLTAGQINDVNEIASEMMATYGYE